MKSKLKSMHMMICLLLFTFLSISLSTVSVNAASDFRPGKTINIAFTAWGNATTAHLTFLNSKNQAVCQKTVKNVQKGQTYYVKWGGRNNDGIYVPYGNYRTQITIGNKSKYTDYFYFGNDDFAGGAGTKANPYLVSNAAQLRKVASYNGKYFKQIKNIYGNGADFAPLFSGSKRFSGTYDGNNYDIQNFNLKMKNNIIGIFGIVDTNGVVKNLNVYDITASTSATKDCDCGIICGDNYGTLRSIQVSNCRMKEGENIGIIAGWNANSGLILNCGSNRNTITATRRGIDMGGIAGETKGAVTHCTTAEFTIKYKYGSEGGYHATGAGAICGYMNGNDAYIQSCIATSSILIKVSNSDGMTYIGNICGDYSSSSILNHIKNCGSNRVYKYGMIGTKV